jgi:ABC-type multidrug transport system permease subunit
MSPQVQKDISGIQNRNGAFFFSLLFFGLSSLSTVDGIFNERSAVRSESLGGHYNPALYVVVKGLVDALLLRIVPAVIFLLPFYYLMGLHPSPGRTAVFLGVVPTFSAATGWLSLFLCTCTSTPGKANFLIVVTLLVSMLFGGFVSNIREMHPV